MSGLRVAGPLYALHLNQSAFEVGLLFSMFGLTAVFFSVYAGRLADRVAFKLIVGSCVLVAAACTAIAAIFPSYLTLCLASLGSGGSVSFAVVALQRFAGRSASGPTELKKTYSWLGVGPSISNFIGPVLAGVLIDRFGHQWAFAAMAVLPLLTWAFVRGVVDNTRTPVAIDSDAPVEKPHIMDLLRVPRFRNLLIMNWVLSSAWDVHSFMVPILGHEFGFSAATIGIIIGSFALAATAVRLVLPVVAERLIEWKVIFCVTLGAALLLAIYPFLKMPILMGVGSVMLGIVLGSVQPMMLTTLHAITPPHRMGEALGIRMGVTNLASVVMPLGFGAAGAALGAKAVFWSVAGFTAIMSRVALRLKPDTD